jgi:hypothetical protein
MQVRAYFWTPYTLPLFSSEGKPRRNPADESEMLEAMLRNFSDKAVMYRCALDWTKSGSPTRASLRCFRSADEI